VSNGRVFPELCAEKDVEGSGSVPEIVCRDSRQLLHVPGPGLKR
jgi:hypothetical protein